MPNPVKICFVGFYAGPLFRPARTGDIGGAEVQLYTLARELARDSGFQVDFKSISSSATKTAALKRSTA